MLQLLRVFFRCLYLTIAVFFLFIGLLILSEVGVDGAGVPLAFLLKMAGWGFGLLWVAVLFRMRAAHWLLAGTLLLAILYPAHNWIFYPEQSTSESGFAPTPEHLQQVLATLLALFVLVTLQSARTRQVLRKRWPVLKALSSAETAMNQIIVRCYLGIASCLLLGAWMVDLYRHTEINYWPEDNIFLIQGPIFFVGLISLLLFGIGMALRMRWAQRVLAWSLVVGMALSTFSLRFLPLSTNAASVVFAPTPDHVFDLLLGSAALLILVVFSAPVITRAVRCGRWRIRRGFF